VSDNVEIRDHLPLNDLVVDLGCIFIGHGLSKDFRTISESSGVVALSSSRRQD
jgi:hypothetical protein